MSVAIPDPSRLARQLFGVAGALHALGLVAVLALASIAIPIDRSIVAGTLRLYVFLATVSLGSYAILAYRVQTRGRLLAEAIRQRARDASAPPPDTMLVRSAHLTSTETGIRTVAAVAVAALADATGLIPVSGLAMPKRLAVSLLCLMALQAIAHTMTIRIRRDLWGLLRLLHPDEVTIRSPQRFALRLGTRVLSAALVPAFGAAAVVLGRPGVQVSAVATAAFVLGIAVVLLLAAAVAIQIGRVAERDIRALAAHVDLLLARGPLDSGTVSEWGEEPMSTNAAVEVVDAMHVLATRYARLASEEERARDALEQAHMLRTRFMAYMSHDLRTPLNSITGFAEVLSMESEGPLNEEQMESVLAIRESGQDLVRLVTNLVDAARLEAGRMTIFPAWTPAEELAHEAIARAQRGSRSSGAPVRIDVHPGLPPVFVDPERTVQALSALLFHLMRECEGDDPGPIRIRLHLDPSAAFAVVVDVHGRGRLEAAEYSRILESFPGAEQAGGRRASGVGIGLALCRDLIMVQGGLLWCDSIDPGEVRFRVRLPAGPRATGRPIGPASPGEGAFD